MDKIAHPLDAWLLKIFQLQGKLCPWPPARSSAHGPRWGTANDCMSVVSSWSNNQWYAPLMFRIRNQGWSTTFCGVYAFSRPTSMQPQ